ncbi:hypothetical protein [Archangium sp.]|jgi:hypothetical protein|uniref:hypothetical protein n=1 Tax=Archangium sp. TaxID=1872627 RepID=UPI002EDBAEA1
MYTVTTRKWAKSLLAVTLLVMGGCKGGEEQTTPPPSTQPEPPPPATQVVTFEGGTLSLSNGATLRVPPEALDRDVQVTLSVSEDAPPAELKPASPLFRFEPSGTVFARPLKVSLPFSGDVSHPTLYWSKADGSGYEPIGGVVENGAIVAEVLHFSEGFIAEGPGTRTVSGVNNETRPIVSGVVNIPHDYSKEAVSAFVLGADGTFTEYKGTGYANGTFSISDVPEGAFYLKTGSTYLVTDQSVLDLGVSRPGRPTAVEPTQLTPLTFNVSNLNAWQNGDHLEFFSPRSNTWLFNMETYGKNLPAVGATSLSGMSVVTGPPGTSSYFGVPNLVDGSVGDRAMLAQLSQRTSSTGMPYTAMSRVIEFEPFSQVDGQEQVLSGALTEVSTANSISLNVKGTQYNAYKAAIGPSPTFFEFVLSVQGTPGGNARNMFAPAVDLLLLNPTLDADLETGTMTYGTPLSDTWGVSVSTRASFMSKYVLPGSTRGSVSISGGVETVDVVDAANAANVTVTPWLSPVQNPRINGTSLFTETSGVGASPVISWDPPAVGTPSLYRINVRRLFIDSAGTNRSTPVGVVYTRGTQVKIPPDLMLAGRSYVLTLNEVQNAVSTPNAPYRSSLPAAFVSLNSALIQMAP